MQTIQPQVTIIIVTRNSKRFMTACLDSILHQTYRDFQTVVIDNDSSDGTIDLIRKEFPMVGVVENNKNLGFARANNHGIRLFKSRYVLLCNPDIVLEPDWLEKMVKIALSDDGQKYSVFGGKLLKLKSINAEVGEMEKTSVIDSCGLKILKNHRVVELGAGEESEKFNEQQEVFGFSGALALLEREALENVALIDKHHPQGDYFDGSFFLYKEDVDLAWRYRLMGFKSLLVPQAIAYHLRSLSGSDNVGAGPLIKNRQNQNNLAKYYSYRNHLLILLADEYVINLIINFPQIFWFEFKKFCYILLFEFKNLSALIEVAQMLPEIITKRQNLFQRAKLSAKELREWYK